MPKYGSINKYFRFGWFTLFLVLLIAVIGIFVEHQVIENDSDIIPVYRFTVNSELSLDNLMTRLDSVSHTFGGTIQLETDQQKTKVASFSLNRPKILAKEFAVLVEENLLDQVFLNFNQVMVKSLIIYKNSITQNIVANFDKVEVENYTTQKLNIQEWRQEYETAVSRFDTYNGESFKIGLFANNGLPFTLSPGHAWVAIWYEFEFGDFEIINTYSSWPGKDSHADNNPSIGEWWNLATENSLHINHKVDFKNTMLSLSGQQELATKTDIREISSSDAKQMLFEKDWYLAKYASPKEYNKTLLETATSDPNFWNRFTAITELVNYNNQNFYLAIFWFLSKLVMNQVAPNDIAYDTFRSNCVAYSMALWEDTRGEGHRYEIFNIPAPGVLYQNL